MPARGKMQEGGKRRQMAPGSAARHREVPCAESPTQNAETDVFCEMHKRQHSRHTDSWISSLLLRTLYGGLRGRIGIPLLLCFARIALCTGVRCSRLERLLEVRDDVVDVLGADRYPNEVLSS